MTKEYKYQCKDYSIITPPFKNWVIEPIMKFFPWFMPANLITIVANIFLYIALFLAVFYKYELRFNFIIIPALIFLYTVGDHIDGAQAKKTGTSSALGEFCDHYLDAFNTGIILVILTVIFNISNIYVIGSLLLTTYLVHSSVFYEQFKTGWIIFDKIGALESVFVIMLVILSGYSGEVFIFLTGKTSIYNLSIIEIIILLSCSGTFITFIKTAIRARIVSVKYYLFISFLFLIILFSFHNLSIYYSFVLIILYSGDYIGKLMRGHLIDSRERYPDFITLIVLSISFLLSKDINIYAVPLLIIYLVLNLFWTSFHVFYPLRDKWVWKNPDHE